jgi:hypothetical protein
MATLCRHHSDVLSTNQGRGAPRPTRHRPAGPDAGASDRQRTRLARSSVYRSRSSRLKHTNRTSDTKDAGGDRRKRNAPGTHLVGSHQRLPIARGQRFGLAIVAAPPHGPNRVDDPSGSKHEPRRCLGLPGSTAPQMSTEVHQFGTGGQMDRTVDPSATKQRRVGGIHDGINRFTGDVAKDGLQAWCLSRHPHVIETVTRSHVIHWFMVPPPRRAGQPGALPLHRDDRRIPTGPGNDHPG